MDDIKKKLHDLYYIVEYLLDNDQKKYISGLINNEDENHIINLEEVFNFLLYFINNGPYFEELSNNLSIKKFDFAHLNTLLLENLYEYFETKRNKKFNPNELISSCSELFKSYNATFLYPDLEIIDKPEKNVQIVEINIKNCKNMVFDIRSLVDEDFIKKHYPSLVDSMGVNNDFIKRFNLAYEVPSTDEKKNDYIIESLDVNIYQKINKNSYRKLKNFKNISSNIEYLNQEIFISNWENKKIMCFKKNVNEKKIEFNQHTIIGMIKNNVINNKMNFFDAIFKSVYNKNMSDEEVFRLMHNANLINLNKKDKKNFEDIDLSFIKKMSFI